MQRTLGTSGAETLSAAANIFVGQTEAPLVIRPYVGKMTQSELMVVMVGGFATIAGGVMAVYVGMGIDAGHLLTASVISAPAALLIAKVMQPETETPETSGRSATHMERTSVNVIEAAAEGATAGLYLALNVGAMLIAFFALIAMLDAMVGYCATWVGYEGVRLEDIFGFAFAPLAWLMGVEYQDCRLGGQLLGIKWFGTEFMAYLTLGDWLNNTAGETRISDRSATILTYALCGFANFASIGIQIGGISAIAPERRADLARLGLRAMFGGTLAACMTGCVAGVLYSESWNTTKSIGGADAAPAVEQPAEESPEAVPPSSDNDSEGDSATVAPRGIPKVVAANRTDANRAGGQLAVGDPVAVRAVAPAMTWQSAADILSSPSVSRIELLATLS
jgi:CNT family concentrative nucleoside transporter